jgi:hypothetical protein
MKLTMLVLFLSLAALGQEQPGGPPPGRHPPMPPPKNLKVLPPEHLIETMRAFQAALGVRCDFCHVQGDFAADDKPHKEIARKMILMTRDINANPVFHANGEMHVTCFTCHRGSSEPATHPGETPHAEHAEHEPHP